MSLLKTQKLDTTHRKILDWIERVRKRNAFRVERIPFEASKEWKWENGFLKHRSNAFFQIGGLRTQSRTEDLEGAEQIILLQPHPAMVGFLTFVDCNEEWNFVFHCRAEPGNLGAVHLAPSIQSTRANYERLHGGRPTVFANEFLNPKMDQIIFDQFQSEQGSRYYGKFNHNRLLRMDEEGIRKKVSEPYEILKASEIRETILSDHLYNKDSRSLLARISWDLLSPHRAAFHSENSTAWQKELRKSYLAKSEKQTELKIENIFHWLLSRRVEACVRHSFIPITQLENWEISKDEIREKTLDQGFSVKQFSVQAKEREVSQWDQPLIDSHQAGRIILVAQKRKNGILHFLIQASREIGFLEGVQFSPSFRNFPGVQKKTASNFFEEKLFDALSSSTLQSKTLQSEEGGRFYQDFYQTELHWIDEAVELPPHPDFRWMSLGQILELVKTPGCVAIELRNAIVPLISFV